MSWFLLEVGSIFHFNCSTIVVIMLVFWLVFLWLLFALLRVCPLRYLSIFLSWKFHFYCLNFQHLVHFTIAEVSFHTHVALALKFLLSLLQVWVILLYFLSHLISPIQLTIEPSHLDYDAAPHRQLWFLNFTHLRL